MELSQPPMPIKMENVKGGCFVQRVARDVLLAIVLSRSTETYVSVSPRSDAPPPASGSNASSNLRVSSRESGVPDNDYRVQITRASSNGASSLALSDVDVLPPDPVVPVFNVALEATRECLWKGEVGSTFAPRLHGARTLLTRVRKQVYH